MTPDVLLRKLIYLRQLLADLTLYRDATLVEVRNDHYKLERIFELLVVVTTDILNHLLAERGLVAGTYRETYQLAAEQKMIPVDLAERLQDAASMRNLIVHRNHSAPSFPNSVWGRNYPENSVSPHPKRSFSGKCVPNLQIGNEGVSA